MSSEGNRSTHLPQKPARQLRELSRYAVTKRRRCKVCDARARPFLGGLTWYTAVGRARQSPVVAALEGPFPNVAVRLRAARDRQRFARGWK